LDKILFWVSVVIVSMIGIYVTKAVVGAYGPDGAKAFVAAI
jgi:hypothetical protein